MDDTGQPSDIHPDSGCRLSPVERAALDPVGQEIYDAHVDPGGESIAGLWGPGGIKLHSPRVSEYTRDLTHYFRGEAGLDPAIRETAILVTARECDSQFEWTAHEPLALKEGVAREVIDAIKHRKEPAAAPADQAAVIRLGREMFVTRRVSSETYAKALEIFGPRMLVDVVSLMGNYAGTAALLCAFDMQVPPGKTPLLPPD
ncbi:MAG: carboxymuconolactone decarboxylase family protein [Alphaproteobacteria bacterium]|nr:carboxymuconolactone decarboxylase family protein [Alphaproteobacteria bacterium]